MLALRELQQAFAAGLMLGNTAGIASEIPDAEARLAIYRNTMNMALTAALKLTYPVVEKLVGADFFAQTAIAFAHAAPPRRALLSGYGEQFPAFLESYEAARAVPYIADVARLEWAVEQAAFAPLASEAEPLATITLPGVTFALAPSLSLLRTNFPAEPIWRAIADGNEAALDALETGPIGMRLAVWRQGDGAAVKPLSVVAVTFLEALLGRADADTALTDAAAADPAIDPIAAITAEILNAEFVQLTPIANSRPFEGDA